MKVSLYLTKEDKARGRVFRIVEDIDIEGLLPTVDPEWVVLRQPVEGQRMFRVKTRDMEKLKHGD